MNGRKIVATVFTIAGIICLGGAYYIHSKVAEGKEEISEAQKKVNTTGAIFSLHPITKEIGKPLTSMAQNKIDEGTEMVRRFSKYANHIQIGGVILLIIGIPLFFLGKKKQRN